MSALAQHDLLPEGGSLGRPIWKFVFLANETFANEKKMTSNETYLLPSNYSAFCQ